MKESLQNAIQDELPDADYPDFEPGDKIRVTTSHDIGGQSRARHFEGVCIARRGEGPDETFKVRKVSFGVGVEKIYPVHSPSIEEIEILRKGKVRRAKLNYLEGRSSKEARIEEERVDLDEINRSAEQAPGHAGETVSEEDQDDEAAEAAEDVEVEEDDEQQEEVAEQDENEDEEKQKQSEDESEEQMEDDEAQSEATNEDDQDSDDDESED